MAFIWSLLGVYMEFMGRHAFAIVVRSLTTLMIVNVQFTTSYSTIICYYVS